VRAAFTVNVSASARPLDRIRKLGTAAAGRLKRPICCVTARASAATYVQHASHLASLAALSGPFEQPSNGEFQQLLEQTFGGRRFGGSTVRWNDEPPNRRTAEPPNDQAAYHARPHFLQGIQFYRYHGVYDEERRLGQRFLVDVETALGRPGAASEDESAAVDYGQVHAVVLEIARQKFAAGDAGDAHRLAILERFPIREVTARDSRARPAGSAGRGQRRGDAPVKLRAFIGMSNVGDRRAHCAEALARLARLPETERCSTLRSWKRSPPKGSPAAPS
jgi:dihydroneopterin aldolase